MTSCHQCMDGFDMEEDNGWSTCGRCEMTLCESCAEEGYKNCARCDKLFEGRHGDQANMMEGHPLCEGCTCYCEACDTSLCDGCKIPHQQECKAGTPKGKAVLALEAAKKHVQDTEAQLAGVVSQIEALRSRQTHLKDTVLVKAKRSRDAAEKRVAELSAEQIN